MVFECYTKLFLQHSFYWGAIENAQHLTSMLIFQILLFKFFFTLTSLSHTLSLAVSYKITTIIIFHLSNGNNTFLFCLMSRIFLFNCSWRFFAKCGNFTNFVNALTTSGQLVDEKLNVYWSILSTFPSNVKVFHVIHLKNLILMQSLVVYAYL